jgi:hypothetical protein
MVRGGKRMWIFESEGKKGTSYIDPVKRKMKKNKIFLKQ